VHGSRKQISGSLRSVKWLPCRMTLSVLVASAMLSSGCGANRLAIPDPNIPHQVATETPVTIWVRLASGSMTKVQVRLLEGWWVASPQVVDPPK
jgi:hypothetical protein